MPEWKKVNVIKFINFIKVKDKNSIPKLSKSLDVFIGPTDLTIDDNLFSIDYVIDKSNSNIKLIKKNKILKGVDVVSIPEMAPGLIQTFLYVFQIKFSSKYHSRLYISPIEETLKGTIVCQVFNGKYFDPYKALTKNILGFLNFEFEVQLFDERLNPIRDKNTIFNLYINNSLAGQYEGNYGSTHLTNAPPLLFGYESTELDIKIVVLNNPLVKKFGFNVLFTAPHGSIFPSNTVEEIPFNLITFNKE